MLLRLLSNCPLFVNIKASEDFLGGLFIILKTKMLCSGVNGIFLAYQREALRDGLASFGKEVYTISNCLFVKKEKRYCGAAMRDHCAGF